MVCGGGGGVGGRGRKRLVVVLFFGKSLWCVSLCAAQGVVREGGGYWGGVGVWRVGRWEVPQRGSKPF